MRASWQLMWEPKKQERDGIIQFWIKDSRFTESHNSRLGGMKTSAHTLTICQMKIIHTRCSPQWGFMLTKAPIWGNRGGKRNCWFTHQFRLIGYLGAYTAVYFLLLWLWLRIEVALITSLGRQSFGEGLKSWFLLSLVSPSWGLFPQGWVVQSKNHLFRPCDVLQN